MLIRDMETPFGSIFLEEENGALVRLAWGVSRRLDESPVLSAAAVQLGKYGRGCREVFDLPLKVRGSRLQRDICAAMLVIPFGRTCTYGDIVKSPDVPAQVVGQACGRNNPLAILTPCHRVMGAKGLTGYSGAGGVETKVALLRHEGIGGLLI